ncbi:permease [Thermococcus chitonophagus]|uniref:Permease n=1 Tax=Thermococcus chitonophagus TaxID=54262 RepID=A0A160VU52_9EURY|nr:DMT family transporter [Thermococcus chitonophagus]ASJ17459.1 permease [Thermococcus chitonophagus]CUX78106.1 Permease of the drug/metabolite transporter (DMT) superfamily [Thermococcus chitonophagus]
MEEKTRASLILLSLSVIWGSTFPIMKVAVASFPPLTFIALRFWTASVIMFISLRKKLKRHQVIPGLILGITLFLGHGFQIVGLKYTTASNSAFITSLYVVFTPFVAYLILRKGIKAEDSIALSLAIIGLYLISNARLSLNYGDLLTMIAALSFAFQIVLVEYFSRYGIGIAFWQVFWNAMLSTSYALIVEGLQMPKESVLLAILYTGIFATALAFFAQVKYQPKVEPYRAAILYSAEPVFGHLFSLITLGEVLSIKGYLGALLIMSAIWIELYKEKLNRD